MKIGKYELITVETGRFRLDGGAMFGVIPKPLWEISHPADELNRIELVSRNLILKSDSKTILVDTGIGQGWDEKFTRIYQVDHSEFALIESINKLGFKPEDITDVILTHLHFDHTGGSTKSENGKIVPAFPKAKYFVQKKNFEWAMNPSDRDKGSYIKDNFEPLYEEGVLNLLSDDNFDDEIDFIVVNGHTFGQQLLKISDSKNTILYCGDLFPTTSHIPLPYVMGYDLQPLITITEKKKILPAAVDENWKLFFEHDPETVLATVVNTDKGFKIGDKFDKL